MVCLRGGMIACVPISAPSLLCDGFAGSALPNIPFPTRTKPERNICACELM